MECGFKIYHDIQDRHISKFFVNQNSINYPVIEDSAFSSEPIKLADFYRNAFSTFGLCLFISFMYFCFEIFINYKKYLN